MVDFTLVVAHLVGDYIVQNDWQAENKRNPKPGPDPLFSRLPDGSLVKSQDDGRIEAHYNWLQQGKKWWLGHLTCTVHCVLYALANLALLSAVAAAGCGPWYPWWFFLGIGLVHWPIDRFGLAAKWMTHVSGQKKFASREHPMWPNSVVLVDNTFHLLTAWALALAAHATGSV